MSRSNDSRVCSHERTGSQHVDLPQATTRQIFDSEAESPARDKSEDRRVKRRLDFGDKSPSEIKEGKNMCPSPLRKAATQRSASFFDRLDAKQKNIPEEYTTDRHSPFSKNILAKPLPEKLKMPQLTSYEDAKDPVGHLDRYTSWMKLQGTSDTIMCRAIPLTFENRAMRWFKKLPQRSIRSWNDLSSQFVSNFMGAKARSTPKERLVSINFGGLFMRMGQQRTDNSYLELKNISALRKQLPTKKMKKKEQKDNTKGKEKDLKPEKKQSPKKALYFQNPGRPRPTPQRFQGYHILNTSIENVLMKTRSKDILKKPTPMRASSSELNQRKYYRYYRSVGYDIDDCRDLKGEIESLIRRGHLKEFLARPAGGVELPPPRDRDELLPPPPHQQGRSEIYTIVLSSAIAKPDEENFSFSEEDASHILQPHSDALVITMPVSEINIHRTLVDDGSSVNVLYLRTFRQMEINVRHVRPFTKPLQEFTGDYVNPKGHIALVVELGPIPCQRRIIADFVIIDLPSNYNAILGRPMLHELKAASSIYHNAIKFFTPHGVRIIRGSQMVARNCNVTFLRVGIDVLQEELSGQDSRSAELNKEPEEDLRLLDPRSNRTRRKAEPMEALELIEVDPSHPEKVLRIGKELNELMKSQLMTFLKINVDVFAWEHTDIMGIDPKVACHRLNTSLDVKPKQQRRRLLNPERYKALAKEVDKLLKCGFIRESLYPKWVANPVLVKKSNGTWRICIDFTDREQSMP
ncbi:Uncharacterized protein Adt_27883 [Abeliophyllum distichum]|uniref:Retrotransposon gag domain-containing protein n=1 Tax=Abeliophyllum distichum TaxID=126358 RepID=A0ABD1RUZ4_9LAMI